MVLAIIAYVIMGVALAAFIGTGAYIAAVIVAIMMLSPSAVRVYRAWTAKPSMMVCPNCGSRQVKITSRVESTTGSRSSQFKRSLILPRYRVSVQSQTGSQINRQRVAVCQSCGFDYPYMTFAEVQQEKNTATVTAAVVCTLVILCTVFGFVS